MDITKTTNIAVKKNIIFIMCSFFPVGLEDYVEFFKKYFNKFIYLKWKFPHSRSKNTQSVFTTFKEGKIWKEQKLFSLFATTNKFLYFLLLPFNYTIYFFQALKYGWPEDKNQIRVFFGINYFCTFCGIFLKKLGKIDYVIYRVMDFFPLPKNGPYRLLNKIFYSFDKYCLKNSDSIWFTTEGHIIGREKYGYFDRNVQDYQLMPLAINLKKFFTISYPKNNLVYCGVVSRYHLLDLVFDCVKILKKDFPDIKLKIIGTGPDEEYFRNLAQKKKLNKNIIFYGFVEEGKRFRSLMADNVLGIALYKDEEDFMKYTEPAKVKYYLNFGVPVVVSDVPKIAKELADQKVSFCVRNNQNEIVEIIKKYLKNKNMQKEYKKNIKNFVKKIDVDYLLEKNIEATFAKLKILL